MNEKEQLQLFENLKNLYTKKGKDLFRAYIEYDIPFEHWVWLGNYLSNTNLNTNLDRGLLVLSFELDEKYHPGDYSSFIFDKLIERWKSN